MDDFEKELKLGFLDEAEQSITDVEQSFLSLETDPHNNEHINQIFRLAHNLKGSSKAVGFEQFGQFTHQFESFVLRVKNNELKADKNVISLLLKTTDFIKHMIQGLRSNLDATFSFEDLLTEMKNFSKSSLETSTVVGDEVASADQAEEAQTSIISFPEVIVKKATVVQAAPKEAASSEVTTGKNVNHDESIRVAVSKVEKLLNSVGEMVILQSVLEQNSSRNSVEEIRKTVSQLSKVTKEIQDISMGLRMIPVKSTFQKMQRIVRDTATLLNKDVNLTLFGEDTELDKSVLENINDPLVHLIRNSVDHGIENAEKRLASGKSAQGHVALKAFHRSGRLVIEVIDDGGGLDANRLKNIALEKGIIKATDVLSDSECYKLIFAPGFSTKQEVTEVSGRGVGMDVVKTNIEKMGGEIHLESALGKGTTIRITLPLTMAIVDGLVTTYNNQKYIVPLSHIHETLKPNPTQIYKEKNLGTVLMLRNENLPLYYLGDFFNEKRNQDECDMIALVFRSENKPFAILVDDILAQQQVVVKRLSADMQGIKGVSGTTILGDGKPSLILEPNDLLLRPISKIENNLKNINRVNKEEVA